MTSIRLRSSDPRDNSHPDEPHLSRLSDEMPPLVFIMGDHRSGTTVLYQSLLETGAFDYTSAYHIIAAAELLRNRLEGTEARAIAAINTDFERTMGGNRLLDGISASAQTPEEYGFMLQNAGVGDRITRRSLPYFRQFVAKLKFLSDGSRPLLLKNPWDFGNFVPVWEWFPSATLVFIHRDPMEIASSKLRALQSLIQRPSPYMAKLSRSYARLAERSWQFSALRWLLSSNWVTKRMIRRMVLQSQQYANYYFQHIATIPASQRVDLSYAGLCASPNETVQRILHTVGVTPTVNWNLAERIKPRKLELEPHVISLKPLFASRLSGYTDYLHTLRV